MDDATRCAPVAKSTRRVVTTTLTIATLTLAVGAGTGIATGSWFAAALVVALGSYAGTIVVAVAAWRTSQRELAAARQDEEETWKVLDTLLAHAPIILSVVDGRGRLVRLEGKGLQTIQADPRRLLGRRVEDFLASLPQIRDWTTRALRGEAFVDTIRIGSVTFANHVNPVLDREGRVVGAIGVATDVTKQVRAEESLRRFNAELELRVAQRTRKLRDMNAEMETFAMGASHDLRAPLRAVYGFARALLEDYGGRLDETGRDFAERILRASEQMDRIIEDLLAYRRVSRIPTRGEPVGLEGVIRETRTQLRSLLERADAEVRVEKPLPRVLGHEKTLVQVLSNLITNGVKFVAEGTRPRIHIRATSEQNRVRVWVEDNGIGIDPADRERIFQLFERLHGIETYPGTGIGLALVRRAVERMGGRVGVESVAGEGSRFWIEIAAAPETSDFRNDGSGAFDLDREEGGEDEALREGGESAVGAGE